MTKRHEPSHLDLGCLQKAVIIDCGSERVKRCFIQTFNSSMIGSVDIRRPNVYTICLFPENAFERPLLKDVNKSDGESLDIYYTHQTS